MASDPTVLVTKDGHEYPNPFHTGVCGWCGREGMLDAAGECHLYHCVRARMAVRALEQTD